MAPVYPTNVPLPDQDQTAAAVQRLLADMVPFYIAWPQLEAAQRVLNHDAAVGFRELQRLARELPDPDTLARSLADFRRILGDVR